MRRLLLTDPEKRIKKPEKRAVQTVHCVLIAFTSCTAELPLSVSISSTTCASISPRSSGRELKLIWPKNAVFFSQLLCEIRRALFCLLMTTSNRKRQVICALTLSLSLSLDVCMYLPRFWYSFYSQKALCGARQCNWTAAGQGCRCIINVICCCW